MGSIAFWYDFASTYSYLSAMRIARLCEEAGVALRWRPFLLGPVFAAQGWTTSPFNIYPAKGRHMWRDMARLAHLNGLAPIRTEGDFPQHSVLAARVAGKGPLLISVEHILPNLMNTLIVQATIQFSLGILAEAALSYVGLGTQPPAPSWGRMLADAQTMIALAPRLAILPGLAIVITVLGLNLLGDGLRDMLDPRVRRAR